MVVFPLILTILIIVSVAVESQTDYHVNGRSAMPDHVSIHPAVLSHVYTTTVVSANVSVY